MRRQKNHSLLCLQGTQEYIPGSVNNFLLFFAFCFQILNLFFIAFFFPSFFILKFFEVCYNAKEISL